MTNSQSFMNCSVSTKDEFQWLAVVMFAEIAEKNVDYNKFCEQLSKVLDELRQIISEC